MNLKKKKSCLEKNKKERGRTKQRLEDEKKITDSSEEENVIGKKIKEYLDNLSDEVKEIVGEEEMQRLYQYQNVDNEDFIAYVKETVEEKNLLA